jgi:hypothetical protein
MKEPKKYKLSNFEKAQKEPRKIPLKSINPDQPKDKSDSIHENNQQNDSQGV